VGQPLEGRGQDADNRGGGDAADRDREDGGRRGDLGRQ
jgi:hypothetical protein